MCNPIHNSLFDNIVEEPDRVIKYKYTHASLVYILSMQSFSNVPPPLYEKSFKCNPQGGWNEQKKNIYTNKMPLLFYIK